VNFYNEIDPYAARWLRNLIAAGHIPAGVVDERSIEDITPDELRPYTQCHFFAGIAGWSHALALAGWPSDRPVWTGSCPCQPFSAAGKGAGFDDQRHLWPAWFHLIRECRPAVIFGEQVASKDAEPWVDLVHADLEGVGYAFGCVPFPAAGVGAPQIRDRAYWVACSHGWHAGAEREQPSRQHRQQSQDRCADFWGASVWRVCNDGQARPVEPGALPLRHGLPARLARMRAYGNAIVPQAAAEFVASFLDIEQQRVMEAAA
jgi:DNA (cytosine-5)-methyltransferase 1